VEPSALSAVLADMDWGHMDGGWWIVMMIGMGVFWALVIVLIVWLARGGLESRRTGGSEAVTPLQILDRRFAEGSITVDEYKERRKALRESTR
jgi:putative membrane protein